MLFRSIEPGQTLCIVGESGSGKSVMATTVMGLLPKALHVTHGRVLLNGESLLDASPQRLRDLRGKAMGMVFQEPMTALNPVMTCGEQIDELLREHTQWPREQRHTEIRRVLELMKLLKSRGLPIVLISHNMPHVFEVADRIHIHRLGKRHALVDPKKISMSDAVAIMTGAKEPPPEAMVA